jgi:ribosomal RNA assembly protein
MVGNMEHILITHQRAALLDKGTLERLRERLNCKIELSENDITVEGETYDEYNAKNVLQAFGRGFDLDKAYRLLSEDCFFQQVNLKDMFRSREQLMRVKARIIGKEGRAKEYIESVSGAEIAVYGGTVSMIGSVDELKVAGAAIQVLLGGGMHKTAYMIMEKEKRKLREEIHA